jgi:hypothetical protein
MDWMDGMMRDPRWRLREGKQEQHDEITPNATHEVRPMMSSVSSITSPSSALPVQCTSLPMIEASAVSSPESAEDATALMAASAARTVALLAPSRVAERLTISLIVLDDLVRMSFLIMGKRATKVFRAITAFCSSSVKFHVPFLPYRMESDTARRGSSAHLFVLVGDNVVRDAQEVLRRQ